MHAFPYSNTSSNGIQKKDRHNSRQQASTTSSTNGLSQKYAASLSYVNFTGIQEDVDKDLVEVDLEF